MFTDELPLTIEEMLIIKGGAPGDREGEGETGSGNGEIEP